MLTLRIIFILLLSGSIAALYADDTIPSTTPGVNNRNKASKIVNKNAEELAKYYSKMASKHQLAFQKYSVLAKKYRAEAKGEEVSDTQAITNPFAGSNAGVGYIANTGNSSTENLNISLYASYVPDQLWKTIWKSTYQYVGDNSATTTNRFYTDLNSIRNLDDKNGVYGDANYTSDVFAGYNYVINQSIGYNRVIFDKERWSFSGQIGPGYMWRQLSSPVQTQDFVTVYSALASTFQLNNKADWQEAATATYSARGTFYTLDNSLVGIVYHNLGLKLDWYVTYDTQAPDGTQKLNTIITASVVYSV